MPYTEAFSLVLTLHEVGPDKLAPRTGAVVAERRNRLLGATFSLPSSNISTQRITTLLDMAPVTRPKAPADTSSRAWEVLTPPLAEWILEAVSSMGFRRMTPVQSSTIPLFMKNSDVVVEVSHVRL